MSLLTLRQAAEAVGLSYSLLLRAAAARQFPTVRLSRRGHYRVQLADVEAWLEQQTVPPRAGRARAPAAALVPPALGDILPPAVERRFA